jgi:H+/Cl- antiporter ClcA
MVGFLSATTAGPITAFIIVMEMVGGQSMVLGLMASAMIATGVARLISRSMYDELAMLLPLPVAAMPPDPTGAAVTSTTAPSPRS